MNPEGPQPEPILPDAPEPAKPAGQNMDVVVPPPESQAAPAQPIQMPPYAPARPPVEPQVNSIPSTEPVANSHKSHHTDVLGLVSIFFAISGALFPIGLIIGLIGASKAKKTGSSAILSRIGWISNLVSMVLVSVLAFYMLQGFVRRQAWDRDTERATDIGLVQTKLEEYFSTNFSYPNDLDDLEFADEQVLIGPNGSTIKINDVASDEAEAKASTNPTSTREYTYTPYGKLNCTNYCDGYVLKSFIEKPHTSLNNPLVRLGLENL